MPVPPVVVPRETLRWDVGGGSHEPGESDKLGLGLLASKHQELGCRVVEFLIQRGPAELRGTSIELLAVHPEFP